MASEDRQQLRKRCVHRHIILHELSHVLCAHAHHSAGSATLSLHSLLPDLRDDVLQRVLTRSCYSQAEEQEAEVLATLLLERVAAAPVLEAWQPDLDAPSLLKWRLRRGHALSA
jgi:hypothetical protein